MTTRRADISALWPDDAVRHPLVSVGGRRRRRSMWQSWILLSDDPPAFCCSGDELCDACRL